VTGFRPRIMVPVDTRGADGQVGNQVSAMVIDLPIGEPDPVIRLKLIAGEMAALKAGKQAAGMKLLTDLSSFTPPALLAMSGAGSAGPGGFMNLTVTNVPGPPRELFLLGSRMLELNPMLPIGNQLTLNVAVESYVDKLSIGVCCDPEAVPDSDVVAAGIASSLGALLERAAAPAPG
jgi:diacylglycerol O-acyltransferase / wax synthase